MISAISEKSKRLGTSEYWRLLNALNSGEQLTKDEVGSILLTQCTNDTVSKPKNDFNWVRLAVGVNDVRPYLNYLYAIDGRLTATNGHIMHQCNTELENGYYCPKARKRIDYAGISSFPDVERIKPNLYEKDIIDYKTVTLETYVYKAIKYTAINGIKFNSLYLNKLLTIDDSNTDLYLDADGKYIVATNGNQYAIIMAAKLN